jgi:hypothetical protein
LSSFPFFAETPDVAVPPKEILIAPAAHVQPTITARRTLSAEKAMRRARPLKLPRARRPKAIDSPTPLRSDPSFGGVNSPWLQIALVSQLPRAASLRPSVPIGLRLATDAVPLECLSARTVPPALATGAAVTNAPPFLLLSAPSSIASPAMPFWSTTRPLWREACRLPAQRTQSAAYLHPSHPSPWSLVTWSHSLSISIPVCNPSNLGSPAPIGLRANQSPTPALQPWSPSRRGYRLNPLLPQPNRVVWAPVRPLQAILRPPTIEAIRPGSEGTSPPGLITVRVQPATMPVLPLTSVLVGIEPVTALAVLGPSSEDTLKLARMDVPHPASRVTRELGPESNTVLPSFSAGPHAPAIGLPTCSHRLWWGAIPPAQTIGTVQPFSVLKRLAWSVTAGLPPSPTAGVGAL